MTRVVKYLNSFQIIFLSFLLSKFASSFASSGFFLFMEFITLKKSVITGSLTFLVCKFIRWFSGLEALPKNGTTVWMEFCELSIIIRLGGPVVSDLLEIIESDKDVS